MLKRHEESHKNMPEGHILASRTYVGGRVEALEACFEMLLPPTSGLCQQQLTSLLENLTPHSDSA